MSSKRKRLLNNEEIRVDTNPLFWWRNIKKCLYPRAARAVNLAALRSATIDVLQGRSREDRQRLWSEGALKRIRGIEKGK